MARTLTLAHFAAKDTDVIEDRPPIRFTLTTLLCALCVSAVYFAGLGLPTPIWASAAVSLTLTILATALVWLFTSPTADKRFWTGFQIAGWSYIAFVFVSGTSVPLLTSKALGYCHAHAPLKAPETVLIEWQGVWFPGSILERQEKQIKIHYTGYGPEWDEWITPNRLRPGGFDEFVQTGDSLIALFVAMAGGLVARSCPRQSSFRFKMLMAMSIVILALTGLATLRVANEIWASVVLTISLAVLVMTSIWASTVGRPGNAFFIGFALCGWCYLLMHVMSEGRSASGPFLLTTTIIARLQAWVKPQPAVAMTPIYFQVIAHSYLILIVGLFGGILGRLFSTRQESRAAMDARE